MNTTDTNQPKREGQFALKSLFVLTTYAAICLLPFSIELPWGILAFIVCFSLMLWFTTEFTIQHVLFVFIFLILLTSLLPTIQGPTHATAKRTRCLNNVRQLALAILNYQSAHGHFPPAYTVDAEGNRLHSWRTLILPYLEEISLSRMIDLDLPWDHPANAQAAAMIPDCYLCPSDDRRRDFTTSYLGVIGDGLIWQNDGNTVSPADVKDGTSNTIMVIEAGDHRVHWMSPDDLQYDELKKLMQDPKFIFFKSSHAGGANVGYADGSARFHADTISNQQIQARLTINGEETINDND